MAYPDPYHGRLPRLCRTLVMQGFPRGLGFSIVSADERDILLVPIPPQRMNRIYKKIIGVAAGFLVGLLGMAAVIAVDGLTQRPVVADMAVVPGNTVYPDGTLSPRLKARLDAALTLYKSASCTFIFVSGCTGKEGVDEAAAMKAYLVSLGVPDEKIIQDS